MIMNMSCYESVCNMTGPRSDSLLGINPMKRNYDFPFATNSFGTESHPSNLNNSHSVQHSAL